MTTNPKTRKAPAAKDAAPKPAPKSSAEPKREISEICRLVSRRKWLEADQDYQASIAATEAESDRLTRIHEAELEEIIAELRILVPQNFEELRVLFDFVVHEIKFYDGIRCDGADIDMLTNILAALHPVFAARLEGLSQMRRGESI